MSLAMSRLVNVLSTNGFLNKDYEGTAKGQRKSVQCEEKTHAILTRLVFQCLKEGVLKDPVNDVVIVPHGIQTTRFIIHLRRYSDFPNRRLVGLFEGHTAQIVGIDRCLYLEKLIHRVVESPNLSIEHFLGLVLHNKLHLEKVDVTIKDGVKYKGIVTRITSGMATLMNDIILNSLEPLFDVQPTAFNVDMTSYLRGDHNVIQVMSALELKIKLNMEARQFVLVTKDSEINIDISNAQLETLDLMLPKHRPLESKVIEQATISSKHKTQRKKGVGSIEIAVKAIHHQFSTIGMYSDDLRGFYLDNLLGYDVLYAKQLKALNDVVNPLKKRRELFTPVSLMKHSVEIVAKVEGNTDIEGFSCDIVEVEGLPLAKITSKADETSVFFPTTPYKPPHRDDFLGEGLDVIRRYLAGEQTIPILFYVFILLKFTDDEVFHDYCLKETVFVSTLTKAGVVDKDGLEDPFVALVSRAKQLVNINTGFHDFLVDNLITIYDREGGGYIVKKDRHSIPVVNEAHDPLPDVVQEETPFVERRKDPLRTINFYDALEGFADENDGHLRGFDGKPVYRGGVDIPSPDHAMALTETTENIAALVTEEHDHEHEVLEEQRSFYQQQQTLRGQVDTMDNGIGREQNDTDPRCNTVPLQEVKDASNASTPDGLGEGENNPVDRPITEEELGTLLYEVDEKKKLEKQAKRIAGLFLRQFEHAIENGNLLRYSLQELAKTKGFEFALQEEGVHVEIDDSTPPQVFAYCIFDNEESVRIFFSYEGDVLDLYN